MRTWNTTFPSFPPLPRMCSPHFGHNVAPSLHTHPEPMVGTEWASWLQLHFPHSPLWGARGAAPLGHGWPGICVWQEDN